jgi:hypothetical protein
VDLLRKKIDGGPGFGEFKTDLESIFERMARSGRRAGEVRGVSRARWCPRRMGVGGVRVVGGEMENGLVEGGERRRRMWAWTSACVVVTGASAAAVIPDHLGKNK